MIKSKSSNDKFILNSHISIMSTANSSYDLSKLSWRNKKIRCLLEIIPNFDVSKFDYYKIEMFSEESRKRKEYVQLDSFATNYFIEVKPKITYFIRLEICKELEEGKKGKIEFCSFYRFPKYLLEEEHLPKSKLVVEIQKPDVESKLNKVNYITNEKIEPPEENSDKEEQDNTEEDSDEDSDDDSEEELEDEEESDEEEPEEKDIKEKLPTKNIIIKEKEEDSDKEDSDKEDSDKEESDKEDSDKEDSDKEESDDEIVLTKEETIRKVFNI
jgi:hypothetical protein